VKSKRKVSVVIAGYNEEKIIEKSLERVNEVFQNKFLYWELILVDDASEDSTYLLMQRFADRHTNVRVMRNHVNLNLGISILRGMRIARYDYIIFNACDLALSPQDMADAVIHMPKDVDVLVLQRKGYQTTKWRKLTSGINSCMLKILFPKLIRGTPVLNFVQIYKRSVIARLKPLARSPIFVWPELVFRAKLKKFKVINKKARCSIEKVESGSFGHPHDIIWGIYDMLRFRVRLWKKDI